VRLALIGGGGSRTPVLYRGLLERADRLEVSELVLHDVDEQQLARVTKVLEGLDAETGRGVPHRTTTHLDDALDGADFVLTAVRAGGFEARELDERIPLERHIFGQETVGAGGFALAVRNVPAVQAIGEAMRRRCPEAWMINLTNPAGMVTQALLPVLGERVIGVCDSPLSVGRQVAQLLGVQPSELHLDYGGLNHLGWVSGVWHRGRDVLPDVLARPEAETIEEVRLFGRERLAVRGEIPNEYVYFYERTSEALHNMLGGSAFRGQYLLAQHRALADAVDRAASPTEALAAYRRSLGDRTDTYMSVEARLGREPDDGDAFASSGGYHEMALSVVEAIACDTPSVLIVNTRNRGALSFLDDDEVVEVPAVVRAAGVFPLTAEVPDAHRALVAQVKEYERRTLAAIDEGARSLAYEALKLHPLVPAEQARPIVDAYAHALPEVAARLRAR
jgi:6-phospho-beta-glucosidase